MAAAGSHPVARLVSAGERAGTGEQAWDQMTAEAALLERDVRQRVHWLATVGNVATMLGLLGTVYGLILAFSGLGDASAVERASRELFGCGGVEMCGGFVEVGKVEFN